MASVNYIDDDEDRLPPMTDEELAQMRGGVSDPGAALPVGPAPSVLAAPPIAPPPTDSGGPPPVVGPANQALAAELAKQPVLPEPKWWQRLAGAGAGAAAGWSNAAGRTRNPVDLNELSQNILAPGYGQKLAEWKSRVAPLQSAAETETARNQAWWKNAVSGATIAEKNAKADYERGKGRTPPLQEVTQEMSDASNGILKVGSKVPASTVNEIAKISAGKYEKPEKTMVVTDPGLAATLRVKVGTPVPIGMYQFGLPHPEKNVTESELRLRAAQGDPVAVKALQTEADTRIRVSKESRAPAPVINFGGTPGPNGQSTDDPLVDSVGQYKSPMITPRSSSPAAMAVYHEFFNRVKAKYPDYDGKKFPMAQRILNDFTSGPTSKSIDAINTVSGHLTILREAIDAMDNGNLTVLNRIANAVGVQTGKDPVTTYNTIVHRVGPELTRSYNSQTSEGENRLNEGDFDPARGTTQLRNALGVTANLLKGKASSLQHRFEKIPGMKFDMITPEAQQAFNELGAKSPGGRGNQAPPQEPNKSRIIPPPVSNLLGSPNVKPGIHTLSDGSKWIKNQDGTITKQ